MNWSGYNDKVNPLKKTLHEFASERGERKHETDITRYIYKKGTLFRETRNDKKARSNYSSKV